VMKTAVSRYVAEDEGKFQAEEKMEEAGIQPAGEMEEVELLEEEVEKQFSEKTPEMESTIEW